MSSGRGGGGARSVKILETLFKHRRGRKGGPQALVLFREGVPSLLFFPSPRCCYFGPQTKKMPVGGGQPKIKGLQGSVHYLFACFLRLPILFLLAYTVEPFASTNTNLAQTLTDVSVRTNS